MNTVSDVIPLICSCCKFHFERPANTYSSLVICPACGVVLTCIRRSSSVLPDSRNPKGRHILLLTVCLQLAVFLLGASVIVSSPGKLGPTNKSLADSQQPGSPTVAMQLTSLSRPDAAAMPAETGTEPTPPAPKPAENNVPPPTPPATKPEEKKTPPVETPAPKPEENKAPLPAPPVTKPEEKNPEPLPLPESAPETKKEEEKAVPDEPRPVPYEERLHQAKATLAEARILFATDGAKSLQLASQAIQQFRELGQPIPPEAYWVSGQSFASQSWGESILEGCPPIENLAVSADGRWLLTSGADRTVWIWDFLRHRNPGEGFKLDTVDAPLVKLFFTSDLQWAIGGTVEGKIHLWNVRLRSSAESAIVLPDQVQGLRDLQVSPDGRWLIAYGGSPNPLLAQLRRDREPSPLSNSLRRALSNDIVTVSWQDTAGIIENGLNAPLRHDQNAVWLWDLRSLQSQGKIPAPTVLRGHEKQIRAMAVSNDSRWLATGGADATVRVFDLTTTFPGAEQTVLKGHRLDVTALAIAPDNAWIASGSRDNTIRIWRNNGSFSSTKPIILEDHLGWISALAVDATGERLISGSYDKTIRVWSLAADQLDRPTASPTVVYGDQGMVRRLAVTKDGKKLVSQGVDASLRIHGLEGNFDSEHSMIIRNRTLPISAFTCSQDSRWLIFNYDNLGNLVNSGVCIWPLSIDDLLEMAKGEP